MPGPGVCDRHLHLAVSSLRRDDHAPAGRRELDGVREQVEDDLANAPLVAANDVNARSLLELDPDAVLRRALAQHHDTALERLAQREGATSSST